MARKSSDPHRGELAKVVSHLAGLGAKGWLLIAVLIAAVWAVERYGGAMTGGGSPPVDSSSDEFGVDPDLARVETREGTAEAANAEDRASEEWLKKLGPQVAHLKLIDGGTSVSLVLPPDRLLMRADGGGLTIAGRLRGGERLKTECGRPAEVASVAMGPTEVKPPPDCPPVAVPTVVRDVSVKNFGREVSRGDVNIGGTLRRIAAGESDPHRNDGGVFGNRERRLPNRPRGYYREYVHRTPGVDGPGPQRLIVGELGDLWYTPDHYDSFRPVVQP